MMIVVENLVYVFLIPLIMGNLSKLCRLGLLKGISTFRVQNINYIMGDLKILSVIF